jgi:hypothetical protein
MLETTTTRKQKIPAHSDASPAAVLPRRLHRTGWSKNFGSAIASVVMRDFRIRYRNMSLRRTMIARQSADHNALADLRLRPRLPEFNRKILPGVWFSRSGWVQFIFPGLSSRNHLAPRQCWDSKAGADAARTAADSAEIVTGSSDRAISCMRDGFSGNLYESHHYIVVRPK